MSTSYIVRVINMKSAGYLAKNTLFLAGSNIILRLAGIVFQAYLAGNIGAQQLGVFGIITSVGVVFATISISGVRFSVTRLASEEFSFGNQYPRALMARAFQYATVFGAVAWAGLHFSAGFLSENYIGNSGAEFPLKIMAAAMPLIALSACVEGYFSAKQNVLRIVIMQLISQGIRIMFSVGMFEAFLDKGIFPSDILAGSFFVGEMSFAVGMFILYFAEIRKARPHRENFSASRLIKTAAPLAVSAYMRTGLSSVGQVIIPSGLKRSGMGSSGAFAVYGIITQMALPVVMFSASLLSAMGDILVPRLTEAQVTGKRNGINYIVNRSLRLGIVFSFGVMGVMLFYSAPLGEMIYKSSEAGRYIKIFAPLIPIIYVDSVTDGCLKGLGQQVYSMALNVFEGIINVALLYIFLPRAAIMAYILIMYLKECMNTFLSIHRLSKVSSVKIDFRMIIKVIVCMCGAWLLCEVMAWNSLVLRIITYCSLYTALLYLLDTVSRDDIKWTVSLFRNKKI